MRIMVKFSFPVDTGNTAIRTGKVEKFFHQIMEDLKPEAAYFLDWDGMRTGFIVFDMQDVSQIPAVAEPWFLAFNAAVEIHPAMTMADLAKAGISMKEVTDKLMVDGVKLFADAFKTLLEAVSKTVGVRA